MYARVAKVIVTVGGNEDEDRIYGIFSLSGESLAEIHSSEDKNTIADVPEGEFVNHVHSSNLSRFINEGEGFEEL